MQNAIKALKDTFHHFEYMNENARQSLEYVQRDIDNLQKSLDELNAIKQEKLDGIAERSEALKEMKELLTRLESDNTTTAVTE